MPANTSSEKPSKTGKLSPTDAAILERLERSLASTRAQAGQPGGLSITAAEAKIAELQALIADVRKDGTEPTTIPESRPPKGTSRWSYLAYRAEILSTRVADAGDVYASSPTQKQRVDKVVQHLAAAKRLLEKIREDQEPGATAAAE